jgi:hypothetical protein
VILLFGAICRLHEENPLEPTVMEEDGKGSIPRKVSLLHEAALKSSLKHLDLQMCIRGEPHIIMIIWKSSKDNKKATIRAKLLTGTYLLQTSIFKFGKAQTP